MSAPPSRDPGQAFARLIYTRHRRSLLNYLGSLGVRSRDQEDQLQEVIRIACEARETYDPAQSLGGWLFGIARNVSRNYLRRPHNRYETLIASDQADPAIEVLPDAGPGPEEDLIRRDRLEMLAEMVGSVKKEEQREALVLHELEEIPLDEMARARGVNPKTMWSRCSAAFEECVGWFRRWRAAERFKGRDGLPVVLLPLFGEEHAGRSSAASPRPGRRIELALARGAVVLIGLSCLSAPPIPQSASEASLLEAVVVVPVPVPAPTGRMPAALPASSAGAAPEAHVRRSRAATAPRPPERRDAGDNLDSRLTMLRAEAERRAGNVDEASRELLEHFQRFPEGPEAAKRNRLLRGLAGR